MHKKLGILQHSLGLNEYGQGEQYRNYFVTGAGSSEHQVCLELVGMGLMYVRKTSRILTGGDDCFSVTAEGILYVIQNSPKPAPEKKLTRSQKRYRSFLEADCGLSFGEWMQLKCKA
jgi:hypothetical protein